MFEESFVMATREKFRFPFNGMISVEDLWDLTPAQLDRVYKALKKEEKASNEESLMATRTEEDTVNAVKIDIVKYIFETKRLEKEAAKERAEIEAKKKHIRELIAAKKDKQLEELSIEDLEKMLEQ